MRELEFVFALVGPLLGLSLVELLGGLSRTVEPEPGALIVRYFYYFYLR